jgi:hypothetical protein
MKQLVLAILAAGAMTGAQAKDELTAQQQRMVDCNKDASAKHLKGQERQDFMSGCLRTHGGSDKLSAQQEKMKTCNRTASGRDLKGDARQDFMRDCLSADRGAAARGGSARRDDDRDQQGSQQDRMASCNRTAGERDLKGDARQEYMRKCLSGDAPIAERRVERRETAKDDRDKPSSQQDRMVSCNRSAGERDLKGDARQDFMRKCLSGDAPVAGRRPEVGSQQERMVACNKQARAKEMKGATRQEFMRDCLKGDTAAAGGRR